VIKNDFQFMTKFFHSTKLSDAIRVEIRIINGEIPAKQITYFHLLLKDCLQDVYCRKGLKFSIPLHGIYYICEVNLNC
jgi:hypothetical protein